MNFIAYIMSAIGLAALDYGCRHTADLIVSQTIGPNPRLPPPSRTQLTTLEISEAVGWQAGEGGLAQANQHMMLMMKGEGL